MILFIYGPEKCGKNMAVDYLKSKNFQNIPYTRNIYDVVVQQEKWRENYVVTLPYIEEWQYQKKRPLSRLILIFAPSKSEWRIETDDKDFYKQALKEKNAINVLNFGSEEEFEREIDGCLSKVRPKWGKYFIDIANVVSSRSNCMKGRVGCVLVKNKRIISTGYNGTPANTRNCYENGCQRCNMNTKNNQLLDYCLCIHAEENALLYTSMELAKNSTLYVTRFPCQLCARKIIQMKIKKVIYEEMYSSNDCDVEKIFKSANIKFERVTDES